MVNAGWWILVVWLLAPGGGDGAVEVVERTPCGADVWGIAGGGHCQDEPAVAGNSCQQQIESEMGIYPLAVRIGSPTREHNCHGFAFGTGKHEIMAKSTSKEGPLAPYRDSYCSDEQNGTYLTNAPGLGSAEVSHSGRVSGPFLIVEHDIGLSVLEHPWNYGDLGGFGLLQYATSPKFSRATTCPAACP